MGILNLVALQGCASPWSSNAFEQTKSLSDAEQDAPDELVTSLTARSLQTQNSTGDTSGTQTGICLD